MRRGRAARRKQDLDNSSDSDFEEVDSEVGNTEELEEWLSHSASKSLLLPGQSLVQKFLPPGTVADLFEHYKATQQLAGAPFVSLLGC